MATPQVKTQKALDFISSMKTQLKTNKDISINYYVSNDKLEISYGVCVRRDYPSKVAKRFKSSLDRFVSLWNDSNFSKGQKLKKINQEDYKNEYGEDEYDEYEIEIMLDVSIKLGKNQEKFFKE